MKIDIYYTTLAKKIMEVDDKFKRFLEGNDEKLLDELNEIIENSLGEECNILRVEDFETGDCLYED